MCKKVSGIYLIKNLMTRRVRVGSATDIQKRFSNYKANLRNGNGNKLMLKDVVDYGIDSFEFIILEECPIEKLFEREAYYLELYDDAAQYNSNKIVKKEKFIRTLEEQRLYREKRSKVTSGENNGHCTVLNQQKANEILWLKNNAKMTLKEIGDIYNVSPVLVSRIGKDRWGYSVEVKPDWFNETA